MRYNRSEIMKAAWKMVKEFGLSISEGLKKAWAAAKKVGTQVKAWKFNDMMNKICNYGDLWDAIDVVRNDTDIHDVAVVDGYVTITSRVEVIKETEKAVCVRIADTWTEWMPKSAIVF